MNIKGHRWIYRYNADIYQLPVHSNQKVHDLLATKQKYLSMVLPDAYWAV